MKIKEQEEIVNVDDDDDEENFNEEIIKRVFGRGI